MRSKSILIFLGGMAALVIGLYFADTRPQTEIAQGLDELDRDAGTSAIMKGLPVRSALVWYKRQKLNGWTCAVSGCLDVVEFQDWARTNCHWRDLVQPVEVIENHVRTFHATRVVENMVCEIQVRDNGHFLANVGTLKHSPAR